MKPGWYYKTEGRGFFKRKVKVAQKMVFGRGFFAKQKGMRRVLMERGIIDARNRLRRDRGRFAKGAKLLKDDMKEVLEDEPDFKEDKHKMNLYLALKADNPYNEIKFFPKYHPELNAKENCWMHGKNVFCKIQDFKNKTAAAMTQLVNECLDTVTPVMVRKFIASTILFSECYRTGTAAKDVYERVKQLKKVKKQHRTAPLATNINHNNRAHH